MAHGKRCGQGLGTVGGGAEEETMMAGLMTRWQHGGKTTRRRRRPISEVATTAIDRDTAERPRWEEEDVTDGNLGLTGGTGSRRRQRRRNDDDQQ
ncbi:hypothetical protein E2562_003344 [Oryza meyeriana var. granulata]|uniref:DUF834 domain-containing protein n=1 Tax=Oryza meyeriana var. granulata TaxID=110450 RepID=A0A6G1EGN7_9ORYZ|nr:hypothetical protein E2562_003344 [Oryza meyeriana var. granulata]